MPRRRPIKKGSFGGHFDELIKHFPPEQRRQRGPGAEQRALQEKRDIHALLFERAWQLERERGEGV